MAETDLAAMIASLDVSRRPGTFTFITVDGAASLTLVPPAVLAAAAALVVEPEGVTAVVPVAQALELGHPIEFVGAWLTLRVNSSLHAVGLTAHVATLLAAEGIACNVLAGHHHDHLLVPDDRADDAISVLTAGAGGASSPA